MLDESKSKKSKGSWWRTIPGTLTAIAGTITALTGLIVALHQVGLFGEGSAQPKDRVTQKIPHSVPNPLKDSLPKNGNKIVAQSKTAHSKLGDEITTAQWIFQVRNVTETDEYVERYYQEQSIIRPTAKNDTLIVVDARLKNRLQKTQRPILTWRDSGNTGIIDYEGQSYQPIDYDARQDENSVVIQGVPVLPGAVKDFALVFSVPKGTKPKTLIFTTKNNLDMRAKDVQVSLD